MSAVGCQQVAHEDFTYQRGVQLLAAGSPKSAIPFFSQVISAVPDGPQPHAMLALAHALDQQPKLAVKEAARVHRKAKSDGKVGWEHVALGVAALRQHQPSDAALHFAKVYAAAPSGSAVRSAAGQWLALALLLKGDRKAALVCLDRCVTAPELIGTRTTCLLWTALIRGYGRNSTKATVDLAKAAKRVMGGRQEQPLSLEDAADADSQELCNAAVAAIAVGDLDQAEPLLEILDARGANTYDASVWLGLVNAAQGRWSQARKRLKAACEAGPMGSQGLANHLYGVVSALESQPSHMLHHVLLGQRKLRREPLLMQAPPKAQRDNVWLSHEMH